MRVLVVGLGQIAQTHIRNLKALEPDCEIAVWRQRPDPPGWQPPKGLPVDRWLYSHDEIEAWVPNAAVIANPATWHVQTAAFLLSMFAGSTAFTNAAHLFIEKPIAASMGNLGVITEIVGYKGKVLMVGYDLRFYRPLQLVKAAIEEGRIGRPLHIRCEVGQYLPDWRPGRDYRTSVSAQAALGGGVILELSHEIDYARWLMGEVVSVTAQTGRLSDLEIDVEDTADILLRFESGAVGNIHLDMADRVSHRECRIVGTEATIVCNLIGNGVAAILKPDEPPVWLVDLDDVPEPNDSFLAEMRHFLACCRGEAVPPVDGAEGRRVLEICLAAKRSAAEGRMITVGHSESSGS